MSINNDLTEEEYRIKYLKYKEKYIALKNQSGGLSGMNCNTMWKDAGWSLPPCNLCANSINLVSKCCIGFREALKQPGVGLFNSLKNAGKQTFKKGGTDGTAYDKICKCGHWASYHNPQASRTSSQIGKQREEGFKDVTVNGINQFYKMTIDKQPNEGRNVEKTDNLVSKQNTKMTAKKAVRKAKEDEKRAKLPQGRASRASAGLTDSETDYENVRQSGEDEEHLYEEVEGA